MTRVLRGPTTAPESSRARLRDVCGAAAAATAWSRPAPLPLASASSSSSLRWLN